MEDSITIHNISTCRATIPIDFTVECEHFCDENGFGTIHDELLQKCLEIPICGIKVKNHSSESIVYPKIGDFFDFNATQKIGHYNVIHGISVFIYRNGRTYVTRSKLVTEALKSAGYKEDNSFSVPFSNGEEIILLDYAEKWKVCI